MKKLNYFAACALAAAATMSANAADFANPKVTVDGTDYYVVKYDPITGKFAEANDFEVDETFIFAIDVTGTPLEDGVNGTSRNPDIIGRGIAFDIYGESAPEGTTGKNNIDGRLMHIKDNIYGMTLNLYQQMEGREASAGLLTAEGTRVEGSVNKFNGNFFVFGYTETNMGAEWWDAAAAPICGEFPFTTAAYTGTKTSPAYTYSSVTPEDFDPFPGLQGYAASVGEWAGYAPSEFYWEAAGIEKPEPKPTFGNPVVDGQYVVKYDLESGEFATSNDWEIDETFVFAVDITGSPLEEVIKAGADEGKLGRGVGYVLATTNGDKTSSIDGRLMHIKDNIYGMTLNFFQQYTSRYCDDGLLPNKDYTEYGVKDLGYVADWNGSFFGFEWTEDNPGANWWMSPVEGAFSFSCAPYTGEKTSPAYSFKSVTPVDFTPWPGMAPATAHSLADNWGGYADPSLYDASIEEHVFANPVVAQEYVVKYDLENSKFAASNDFEIDETIVFAVDITGSPLEALLAEAPGEGSVGRGIGYVMASTNGEATSSIDGRLMHIAGNIYGMTLNIFQQCTSRFADSGLLPSGDILDSGMYAHYGVLDEGYVTNWNSSFFGFEWAEENPGSNWWMSPVEGAFPFSTAAYTGNKKSAIFTYKDVTPEDFTPWAGMSPATAHGLADTWGGYADPSLYEAAINFKNSVKGVEAVESNVVKTVYYDLQGRQIENPAQGLYIRKDIKADGTVNAVKVLK